MEKAAYFILILCGILSQGICQESAENNEESSDLQIRQKRVAGGAPRSSRESPYLVHVLKGGNSHCPATLLSNDVAITSAACFVNQTTPIMQIMSYSTVSTDGTHVHPIVRVIFLDPNYNQAHPTVRNLVLVKFAQPIEFNTSPNRPISIYRGFLPAEYALIHAITWGRPFHVGDRRIPSVHMRQLSVSVISIQYCQSIYPNMIHSGNICTVGTVAGDHCENRDTGIPLVLHNQLLGIFVYHGGVRPSNPDVFMNLLDHNIRRWIHEHVPSLNLF